MFARGRIIQKMMIVVLLYFSSRYHTNKFITAFTKLLHIFLIMRQEEPDLRIDLLAFHS